MIWLNETLVVYRNSCSPSFTGNDFDAGRFGRADHLADATADTGLMHDRNTLYLAVLAQSHFDGNRTL